jgi:DNA-binding IclR family transcriptional regulator
MSIIEMSPKKSLKEEIFQEFLQDSSLGPSEMTKKLGAKYNSVKAAFAKLAEEGFLERLNRGSYRPNMAAIVLDLMDRIEKLESQVK